MSEELKLALRAYALMIRVNALRLQAANQCDAPASDIDTLAVAILDDTAALLAMMDDGELAVSDRLV